MFTNILEERTAFLFKAHHSRWRQYDLPKSQQDRTKTQVLHTSQGTMRTLNLKFPLVLPIHDHPF